MSDPALELLYTWFDRLADLSIADQQAALEPLRAAGDPMVLQLEGLLQSHRRQDPTSSPFSVDEILDACATQSPMRLASDLRDLSQRLSWDATRRCFRLGNYALKQCLSVSSIGATYRARDEALDREVVVLLAWPRWNAQSMVQKRMIDSSRAVAKVFHPNVATILGTFQSEGISGVVRQWIPGQNLEEWLETHSPLSMHDVCKIAIGIARGLQAIHQENVLHGDLKPSNIIARSSDFHPVITDFGTALWLGLEGKTRWQGGTHGFVAPEILVGEPPTIQSDLYSLGVVLFWLATGTVLQDIDDLDAMSVWGRQERLESVAGEREANVAFAELVLEMVQIQPSLRPQTAESIAETLAAIEKYGVLSNRELPFSVPHPTLDHLRPSHGYFHGGARPLPWERLRSRRSWMLHSLGFAACAGVSAWAGRVAANFWTYVSPTFVPGTGPSFGYELRWDASRFDSSTMRMDPSASNPDGVGDPIVAVSPKLVGRWIWLESDDVLLPNESTQVGLADFCIVFNGAPRSTRVRAEYAVADDKRWHKLVEYTNDFGGHYRRICQVALPKSLLRGGVSFRLRTGMILDKAPDPNKSLQPSALQLKGTPSQCTIGHLGLWKDKDTFSIEGK